MLSKFDVSWFSVTGGIGFQIGHFADFEQLKVDIYFANFGQVKIDPTHSLLLPLDRSQLFYWFGQDIRLQKTIQTLSV